MLRARIQPWLPATLWILLVLPGCGGDGNPRASQETSPAAELQRFREAEAERLAALAEVGPAPPPTRGYLVISFDTLRADHLGAYGYERDTSPFFDELAARGTLFENAVVQYPSTLTSHMSIFTGLYPTEHGVFPPDAVLSPEIETFPEVFQRAGFKTAGYTEGGFMRGRFGFRRGFDDFRARDRQGPREVEHTFDRGVRFLASLAPDDRFLLFLHTYAVHAPYEPPEGYEALFQPGPVPETFPPTGPQLVRVNAEQERLSPEVIAYFQALYDATLRYLDDTLRGLFGELERLGIADEVTVVLTSDHGEEFQEHGQMNHVQLYREVTHVPLVILHPNLGPGRYEPLVESVDLAATLYELAGLEPGARTSGVSVARVLGKTIRAGEGIGRTEAYAEEGGKQRALWRRTGGTDEDRLLHLLTFEPGEERWIPRRLKLDTGKTELRFEARSYEGSQDLTLAVAAEEDWVSRGTVRVGPEWTPVFLELPPLPEGRVKHRVELAGERCTVPEEVRKLRLWRCHGFQLRGLPQGRVELYDLLTDPQEQRDLSLRRDRLTRRLLRFLRVREFVPRAVAGREELDAEAERNLRALGYLQ